MSETRQQAQANASPSNWTSQSAKMVTDAQFEHQNGPFWTSLKAKNCRGASSHNTALDRIASYALLPRYTSRASPDKGSSHAIISVAGCPWKNRNTIRQGPVPRVSGWLNGPAREAEHQMTFHQNQRLFSRSRPEAHSQCTTDS